METWRCPTCLTVLVETGAKRCPYCHSKLRRRRSQPIVLGESSRLDMQAALAVESAEPPQIPLFDEPVDHQPAPPLRLTVSSAGNRRRWSRRDA